VARTAVNIAEAYAEVLVDSLTEELDASARLLARVEDPDRIVELFGLSAAEILALQDFTFCSTQVNIEDPLKTVLLTYGSLIPDDAIVEDGREDEPHITVKYGLHDDDPAAVAALLAGERPVRWRLGPTSIFTTPDADVLKIGVTSPDLHRLNRRISEHVDVTDTFPEYVPHVTIAYLQPRLGARFAGDATFAGLEGVSDTVLFSNRDGEHTPILLTGRAIKAASTRPILNAADAHRAALKKAIITAFHAGRGKITRDQIKQALTHMRGAAFNPNQERDDHGRWIGDRASRAIETHKPVTRLKRVRAEVNEARVAKMIAGSETDDNAPTDVTVRLDGQLHGIEVKTFIDNAHDKITMHPASLDRKVAWGREHDAVLHTVVFDNRPGHAHELYYKRGVGSFRLGGLTKVANATDLKRLMTS
jgi:2'-5' RNA ligase